jgi:5-methylcytosine-specific restriction protein A
VLRDRHCRHPGCDRGPQWCEAHHVRPWSEGGPTELANLVMGCSRHHHLWHLAGWSVKLLPDGEFHVTTPDGRDLVSRPPPLT